MMVKTEMNQVDLGGSGSSEVWIGGLGGTHSEAQQQVGLPLFHQGNELTDLSVHFPTNTSIRERQRCPQGTYPRSFPSRPQQRR